MSNAAFGDPDIHKRESAIIRYLRERPAGATARDIHTDVSEQIGDNISRPAYYKVLDRLVAAGKVEHAPDQGATRYVLPPPQLHATSRMTLDDVYEALPYYESTESMARALEAQQSFMEHRDTIARRAAEALAREPAAPLFHRWIESRIVQLQADLASYHHQEAQGEPRAGQAVLANALLERRIQNQVEILRDILYRQLSIPLDAVDLPDWDGLHGLKHTETFHYDSDRLGAALQLRVFGVGDERTVLGLVTVEPDVLASAEQEMIISGSDGSFHAGTLGIRTAHGYIEDDTFVVTFNNSVAYVRPSERVKQQKGNKQFVHSAPMTRQTLDDPAYKGMVLAPFMFPTLTDSEYEHMTRAASDVVQMRVDDEVFSGKARDVITGEQILAPRVHIRDGTITPQERGFNHYSTMNPYGDIAREGIARGRSILQRIVRARAPQVYAGAVKSTQIRLFSRLVNWYIAEGSRATQPGGAAIAPDWDAARASYISDVDLMTALLASLPTREERDGFWRSCVVIRQFASLTDFFYTDPGRGGWFGYLAERRRRALEEYDRYHGALPYHALQSEDDLQEDPYLYLLEHADYASFYIGHTHGSPAPKIPRYEFFCSLRDDTPAQAEPKVQRAMEQLTTALTTCGLTQDRDHNFLSHLTITKIIPFVVYRAHEIAKALGEKLEGDYKSAVVARLATRRGQRLNDRDVDVRPVSARQYLQRFIDARKGILPSERQDDER